ncbi:hypothetical protein [Oscillibacter sp.]|uniref:hypothetical protein n=1 Tax=Oscillibacter sp. TaxID=1945593 RepID=UPI001B53F162|nr:hypothetical protein [Oscillibacter sp.]MBP3510358.1 hypothetical protein [Oscillibacter sp.]
MDENKVLWRIWVDTRQRIVSFHEAEGCELRPGVKFCVNVFRQSQEWRWKAGRILA